MKGWRTIVINVLSLAGVVFASEDIFRFIPPERAIEILGVVNILMRFVSTTPVGVHHTQEVKP
jgi:hypothetical protein